MSPGTRLLRMRPPLHRSAEVETVSETALQDSEPREEKLRVWGEYSTQARGGACIQGADREGYEAYPKGARCHLGLGQLNPRSDRPSRNHGGNPVHRGQAERAALQQRFTTGTEGWR